MKHQQHSAIVTVRVDASLREAARLLREERVGALVVVDGEGRGVGMVTDRDLAVRGVAWGRSPERTDVGSVMSSPLDSLDPEEVDLVEAVKQMRANGRRRLPVCVDGKPIGMITFDDLLDTLATWLGDLTAIQASRLREGTTHETSRVLKELQRGVARARELRWKAQDAFLRDLDQVESRVKHLLDDIL